MRTKNILARLIDQISTIKPFLIAVAFSPWLIILYIVISTYTQKLVSDDQQIIQSFIEWFGTAYSLFLALVLVNVWNQFDTTDREFDREVDALATLYQTVNYGQALVEKSKNNLTEIRRLINIEIEKYLRHVITNYQNEHISLQQRRNGDRILENIGENISVIAREKITTDPLIAELFRNLNEARDVRGDRISHCRQRIPQTIWTVAVVASLVWLLPYFALEIKDSLVKGILIGGVAFVIVIVLIIIQDFDGIFDGTWKVSIDSWHEFLETFDPNPRIIIVFKNNNWLNDLLSRTNIGRRFVLPNCQLSRLSREFLGYPWRKFIKEIQRYHPNKIKEAKCDIYYLDEYALQGYALRLNTEDLPIVLIRIGDKLDKLVLNQEIIKCSNLSEFVRLFYKSIKSHIPDFENWSNK